MRAIRRNWIRRWTPIKQMAVGATALCCAILHKNGMVQHVGNALDHNPKLTMTCMNLAIHAALTTDKTYLANQESTQQKFIEYGCPSSSRASEFFQHIGADQSLSQKMAKSCAAQMKEVRSLPSTAPVSTAILKT